MVKFWYGEVLQVQESVFSDCATKNDTNHALGEKLDGRIEYSPHQSLALGDVMVNCADTTPSKAMEARARLRNMVEFCYAGNVVM